MSSHHESNRGPELWGGVKQGLLLGAAVLTLTLPPGVREISPLDSPHTRDWSIHQSLTPESVPLGPPRAGTANRSLAYFALYPATADARFVANWVTASEDNQGLPFVVLDKRDARVYVFDPAGRIIDASPVLIGAAAGDDSVSGIGSRPIAKVRPEERTTPAGRFVSEPGKNAAGDDIVWIDYDAAVSMHRVRPVDPSERRLERLASADPAVRRISYGCINVPVAFFESVIWPVLGSARGVVYVLPETKSVREVFAAAYRPGAARGRMTGPPM